MLGLLLLQVLASCLWLGHSEVVNSFDTCPQFFYSGLPPDGALNIKKSARICQRFRNSYHYATLYDRKRRIPVYSAYKYQPVEMKRPQGWQFVEPQLIDENLNLKDMETESLLQNQHKITLDDIKKSQAVRDDYKVLKGLNHGHLAPSAHMDDSVSKMATFTFTNIVPQYKGLNDGQWRVYEHKTMIEKTKGCTSTYVITGAVPRDTNNEEERVNVPSHIWSAACCLVNEEPKAAWGAIAENNNIAEVENITLGELEERLTELYEGTVTLFNNACPRQ